MRKIPNDELGRLSVEEFKKAEKLNYVIVLDNVRSSYNVGSVFRTADAFLCEKIFLCGISAKPPHKEINKTALGATESVDWEYFSDTSEVVKLLKNQGFTIVAVEQVENAVMLNDFIPEKNKKYAFIFGHEVKGIDQKIVDMADFGLEIPQFGTKHSLNISVSVGVILWHFVDKVFI